jgi:hypothetical protein
MTKISIQELAKKIIQKNKQSYSYNTNQLRHYDSQEVFGSPEREEQFKNLVYENHLIANGLIPSTFIFKAECINCGKVLLDFDPKVLVLGCPWCFCDNKPKFFIQ